MSEEDVVFRVDVQHCIAAQQARIEGLEGALHEIYSKACKAMGEDDDFYLWQFAQEARDIALAAKTALLEAGDV